MDRIDYTALIKNLFSKYKYMLLILGIGIILMSIPTGERPSIQQDQPPTEGEATQAEKLEEILCQISGVGRVKVLLTEAASAETVYQTNEEKTSNRESESIRIDTVVVTNSEREELGLVRSITPPIYLGAIIVCQGGDNPSVKLAIVEAVSNVTGISSDRITVLKMK